MTISIKTPYSLHLPSLPGLCETSWLYLPRTLQFREIHWGLPNDAPVFVALSLFETCHYYSRLRQDQ